MLKQNPKEESDNLLFDANRPSRPLQQVPFVADRARLSFLVSKIGTILSQTVSFPQSLQQSAEELTRHLDSALVRIWACNRTGDILELQTSEGLHTHLNGPQSRIPIDPFLIGMIARERQTYLTNDLANDPRVSDLEWVRKEKLVSFAGLPLVVDDRLVGVLGLFACHRLQPETLAILESLSTNIAVSFDRKRAQAELSLKEDKFRMTFAGAPMGLVLTTMEGLLLETNHAYCEIVGYTPEQLSQTALLDVCHPEDAPVDNQLFSRLLQGELPSYTMKKRYVRQDGEVVWVKATTALLRDSLGVPQNVIGLVEDISAQREIEEERERLVTELARSNEELSRFAHVAAHDLQSPIRTVRNYLQLLERRVGSHFDSASAQCMRTIFDSTRRMERLIESLLHFAGIGQDQREHLPVAIPEIVVAAKSNLNQLITDTGADVLCGELPTVFGDQVQLLQLIENLIANGIKYRNPLRPPSIRVSAKNLDRYWEFSISDNGQGIAQPYQSEIFVPLKRLHGDEIPGTGMGLSICKKIVERHGGRIWLESEPEVGSTFFFTLPARP